MGYGSWSTVRKHSMMGKRGVDIDSLDAGRINQSELYDPDSVDDSVLD